MPNSLKSFVNGLCSKSPTIFFGSYTLVLALILVGLFDFMLSKSVFPITDGWWETYAWLIQEGLSPYRDFSLKLTPLYVYYNLFLIKIFGIQYYELKMIAIALHSVGAAGVYFWLRRFVGAFSAGLGTIIAVSLVMSNPVYLSKDYHTLVLVLTALTMLTISFAGTISGISFWQLLSRVTISSLLCGVILLTKQNIGIFFSFGIFLYWISCLYKVEDKKNIKIIFFGLTFVLFFLMPALLLTLTTNADWLTVFIKNDSKGGLFVTIFRFALDKNSLKVEFLAVGIVLVTFLYQKTKNYIVLPKQFNLPIIKNYFFIFFVLVVMGSVNFLGGMLILAAALAWPILRILILEKNNYSSLLALPLYAIAYCGTQTAGYNFVSLELLLALMTAEIINIKADLKFQNYKIYSILAPLAFIYMMTPKIAGSTYNWWGLKTDSILDEHAKNLPFKELKGIETDIQTSKMFKEISDVKEHIEEKDTIFAYPSIPIVYQLLGKKPLVAPVLWFDVAGSGDGRDVIRNLNVSKPKYIFWLRPPWGVYVGHFSLRKMDPAMIDVDDWLINEIKNGQYEVVSSIVGFDKTSKYYSGYLLSEPIHILLPASDDDQHSILINKICKNNRFCYVSRVTTDGVFEVKFRNSKSANEFIESVKLLAEVDEHVFYVLKRK